MFNFFLIETIICTACRGSYKLQNRFVIETIICTALRGSYKLQNSFVIETIICTACRGSYKLQNSFLKVLRLFEFRIDISRLFKFYRHV